MRRPAEDHAERPYAPRRYRRRLRVAGILAVALIPLAIVAGWLAYAALIAGDALHRDMLAKLPYPAPPSPGTPSRLIVKDHLDGTIVRTPWIKLDSSMGESTDGALYLRLQDWYPGAVRSEVREEVSVVLATSGNVRLPQDWRSASLTLFTNKELVLNSTEYEMGLARTFPENWQASAVQVSIATEDLVAAVNHGKIHGRIGAIEFSLDSGAIQIIDEFAAYLRPGTSPRP